jgi:DNA-binding SARP family transcriptional activator
MLTTCSSGSPVASCAQATTSLPRHRLADQLAGRRFAAVIALAGFGKTTLLAQVARAYGRAVTWCRTEPGAGQQDHCRDLAQALLNRCPTAAELASADVLLDALRRDRNSGRRLVVVDDLHLRDRESRDLVLRVGQLGAPYPSVLVGSRPADGIDVATFEAAGATVLDTDELSFRSWEVERLFREFYGAPLGPDTVLPLTRLTGGQGAALHQLARVTGGHPGPVRIAQAPSGRDDARSPADQPGRLLASALGRALPGAGAGAGAGAGGAGQPSPAVGGPDLAGLAFAGRLGEALLAVFRAGPAGPVPSAEIHRIAFQAEREGQHWATRVARCLLGLSRCPEDAQQLTAVRQECVRLGDQPTEAFATGMSALRAVRTDQAAVAALEVAVSRFRSIGWTGAEAWARAALALVEAGLELPDAAERAGQAEAFARAAGVPGAQVVAIGALALVRPDAREELLDTAWSMAESAGLPVHTLRTWMNALGLAADGASRRAGAGAGRAPRPAAAGSAPPVMIRCFGGFSLTVADREPDWSQLRPRQLALLRLLAVHADGSVHRTQLIESFWPDLPPARAVHNVQVTVSRLRTFLEPGLPRGRAHLIVRRGESYRLMLPPGSTSDVVRFEQAARAGRRARDRGRWDEAAAAFRNALEEYTGELLPEDGAAEWLVRDRERLSHEAADAGAALARLELDRGRPVQAVEAATRSLAIDRYEDAAWRVLIAGHESAGQAAAAARARQQYADLLAGLGFEPAGQVRTPA